MKQNSLILLLLLLAMNLPATAEDFASAGYAEGGAEYLKLPLHARAAGLAGAVTAWKNGLTGSQFNPAIVDAVEPKVLDMQATYSIKTYDRRHFGLDAAASLGSLLAFGFSYTNHGIAEIEGRDIAGIPTEDFSFQQNALALSVAGRLQWPVSLGARFRYLNESLDDGNAHGIGFDLGATWSPLPFLTVGASAQHLLSYVWWSTGSRDQVFPTARVGIAGIFLDSSLIAELDISQPDNQPLTGALGIEYTILKLISLRGGLSADLELSEMNSGEIDVSLGVGMRYEMFGFDYALVIPGSDLGLNHKVTLVFNPKIFR